jgi:hypothetical protein
MQKYLEAVLSKLELEQKRCENASNEIKKLLTTVRQLCEETESQAKTTEIKTASGSEDTAQLKQDEKSADKNQSRSSGNKEPIIVSDWSNLGNLMSEQQSKKSESESDQDPATTTTKVDLQRIKGSGKEPSAKRIV